MKEPISDKELIELYAFAHVCAPLTNIGREFPELQDFMARQLFVEAVKERVQRATDARILR